jgi:benzoylformate decarboxylase
MGALSRDQKQVREKLEPYDLLICLGADVLRMSVWSPLEPLPDGMPVIQISERAWELGKNYPAEIAINADVRETLRALLPILDSQRSSGYSEAAQRRLTDLSSHNWTTRREKLRQETLQAAQRTPIDPNLLMLYIAESLPADAVVVDEGLTASRLLPNFFPMRDARSYYGLASGGIGFAVAGTIGIQLAQPDRPLVSVIGDGSSMYNIQALWTAAHLKLPITYVIANNKGYRILKQRLLAFQGNDNFIGMDFREPEIDFAGLAQSLGLKAQRVSEPDAIKPALQQALADSSGPHLIDVAIDGSL